MFAMWEYKEDIRWLISFIKLLKDLEVLSTLRPMLKALRGAFVDHLFIITAEILARSLANFHCQ